jgi:hypothetical protein
MKRNPTTQKAEDETKNSMPNAAFESRKGVRFSTWPELPVRFQRIMRANGKLPE